ncbi:glycine betaine/proline transport system substrate-binding protein [Alkalibacterium subtropicum]|uniref:Glycine betaine/proline transport system substrate-binding protein n=1 Tax=Alkalibacterium subtropicum TaxID=753702 RepID=A0A1I1KUU8_9LACT|nr:glycine betaine ABC transporter substrate-binding protein [Alkalibacterium subtropicum]SFC64584.1 glycine betaine/proline transport system substrate-binding protein [Alkalibacterium subtropicum]
MKKITLSKTAALLAVPLLLTACGDSDSETSQEENIGEAMNYTITGIEPGAGMSQIARQTLEEYDNLEGWEIQESSTAGVLTELGQAIQNEEPIVVAGWTPHYKFEQYDLKILDDPKNVFGDAEGIYTLTRTGLEEEMPQAYEILSRFEWEPEHMQEIMLEALDRDFEDVAGEWVDENRELVDEWTEGIDDVDGESFELGSLPWDTERSSSNVVARVLEEKGYDVTITNLDPAVLYQALNQGEVDATVGAWLPTAQGAFMETYGENIVDLGPNLNGTVIGFVVPTYMEDIDSIEDLPARD